MFDGKSLIQVGYTEEFRNFIKKDFLEEFVLKLLNRSDEIFHEKTFIHNSDQSHVECDYIDTVGSKYEPKILFNKKQGKTLGEEKNEIIEFFQCMLEEVEEFSDVINQRDISLVEKMQLYRISKERLKAIKPDENILFFIPFSIGFDAPGSYIVEKTTDYSQAIYERLKEEGFVGSREFYYIYPYKDGCKYVLRNADKRIKEYISMPEYSSIIRYEQVQ